MTEKRLKKTLTLLIAGATVLGSTLVVLAVQAGGRSNDADRDSRLRGIAYLTFNGKALWDLAADKNLMVSYRELEALGRLEEAYAGYSAVGERQPYELAKIRYDGALDFLAGSGRVFAREYFDRAAGRFDLFKLYVDRVYEPSVKLQQEQEMEKRESVFWDRRADAYTLGLTILAVAVFLLTLCLAIPARVRFVFAGTGLALMAVIIGLAVLTRSRRLYLPSDEALGLYARASGKLFLAFNMELWGNPDQAFGFADEALGIADKLVRKSPFYPEAVPLRGATYQMKAEAKFFQGRMDDTVAGNIRLAVADYERAQRSLERNGFLFWSTAHCRFMEGRYSQALSSIRRAAALLPEETLGLGLNEALYLLHQGKAAEAEALLGRVIRRAHSKRRASDNLYFRTVIRNIARLGEIRPVPRLENMERTLKEAFLSITYLDRPEPLPVRTEIRPLVFVIPKYDDSGKIVEFDVQDVFPRFVTNVNYMYDYKSLDRGSLMVQKVYWRAPGQVFWREQVNLAKSEKNAGKTDGRSAWTLDFPLPGAGQGLASGLYRVELYVQGNLLSQGEFTVQ